ncbi:outer membrane protein assembly factor BamB family protein [Catellatospora tritici]|uniref:outer membrane protein assembly factor BamB family protein n=1 Tax=Catellatospora tritici TaxID=2851566 RepID=UPI001C2D155B|nr:PQQ-binding-like beta-propeller repeat protein [Catellatospora tritici]MBV1851521.1 PQQ-like beta-propeller repeat protein [Catellatospora tritici]
MMRTDVIDLGDGWGAEDEVVLPPRRVPELRRRVACALVLLLAGTLGAAAAPVREIAELGRFDLVGASTRSGGDTVQSAGDLLVVQGDVAVSAYRITDGTLRWRVPHSSAESEHGMVMGANGVVLLADSAQTTAFDAETGATLWSRQRGVYPVGDIGVELINNATVWEQSPGGPAPGPDTVTGFDLRTGRTLWTVLGTPYATVDHERRLTVTATADGAIAVYDARDGRPLRRGEAKFPAGRPMYLSAYSGVLRLASADPAGGGLSYLGYDLTTLRPLPTDADFGYPCGRYRCEEHVDQTSGNIRVTVVDPQTRAVRWQPGPNTSLVPIAAGFIVVDATRSYGRYANYADRLVDPDSGRTLLDLTGWLILGAEDGSQDYLLVRDAGQSTQVARIVGGGVRMLGVLPDRIQQCVYRAARLSCVVGEGPGRLVIWRVDEQGGR